MSNSTGPVAPRLLIEIDRGGELTLHEQIEGSLRAQIQAGLLAAGTRLPSTRGLAAELRISRGVVTEAYGQLAAEGYLSISRGAPVRVAATVRRQSPRPPARSLTDTFRYDMRPSLPDLAAFPAHQWLRSVRAALTLARIDDLAYPDPRGRPELREALADYLGRVRGAAAEPEHTVITTGFMQAFSLLCRALASHGITSVAIEDPGAHVHRLIIERSGLTPVPIPVDEEGIVVSVLADCDAAAVVLSPAHQFPTGAVLSPRRRAQLIQWAESEECLIIEDDWDGELRHDAAAVGALQGLAPERVLYIGSASLRLAPALRIGWMLAPSSLAWPLSESKAIEDGGAEVIGQLALTDFIRRGELDRHLRRMRLAYSRKRRRLLGALARHMPSARLISAGSGIFELLQLPAGVQETDLIAAAASRGLGCEGLQLHRFATDGPQCVLIGCGALPEPAIDHAIRLLSEASRQVTR